MKILASDFDNTIYYLDNEEQNKKNADAIRRFYTKEGNTFCIITGRNYTDLKKLLVENAIPYNYLVCEDGAIIFDEEDRCLNMTKLDKESISNIRKILDKIKCDYYLDDGYQKTTDEDNTIKVVVNCTDEEEKESIVKLIKEQIDVHIYASRFHVNIINKVVNKKYGINKLFEIEKLDYDNLYVIGDNDNDYEMLKSFKGAIIKDHHPKLDEIEKQQVNNIAEYIEELMKEN